MIDLSTIEFINKAVNEAMRPCAAWYAHGACTDHWRPTLTGDCKQFAAVKLRELIVAGADPSEFTIWIVRQAGARNGNTHAVLVHNPTQAVLDLPTQVRPGVGMGDGRPVSQVLSRRWKERREGMAFLRPCAECAEPARAEAARVPQFSRH